MKFTKEEISLCKQVAERHKKPIEFGSWYTGIDNKPLLHNNILQWGDLNITHKGYGFTPLWTISDCLEFLWKKKKRDCISLVTDFPATAKRVWRIVTIIEEHWGDTPLEACLKAVLAVLEEEK